MKVFRLKLNQPIEIIGNVIVILPCNCYVPNTIYTFDGRKLAHTYVLGNTPYVLLAPDFIHSSVKVERTLSITFLNVRQ
jgi:hypothetical protein